MEVHVYDHWSLSSTSFYGLVGVCLHYNFSWSDNLFFFLAVLCRPNTFWSMYPGTVWCTPMLRIAILKKKSWGRKNIAISIRISTTAVKVVTDDILGKTPVSLPITTGYSLPPTWDRFRQKKKAVELGMTGQNCTSLHWIPYILARRQLTLAHQATFQIGRQFRFPWQPAENGWLEIGLYWSKGVCERTIQQPIRKRKNVKLPKEEDEAGKMANASFKYSLYRRHFFAKK